MRARKIGPALIGAALGAATLLVVTAGAGAAPPPRRGGGPAPHPGGGAPHFAPHIAPHIAGGGAPHFAPHINAARHFAAPRVAAPRLTGRPLFAHVPRISHFAAPHVAHIRPHMQMSHPLTPHLRTTHAATPNARAAHLHPNANIRPGVTRNAGLAHTHVHGMTDPRNFAAHRHLAGAGAFRPFLAARWHPHHHLGWVGPMFWPYAYGDVFFYALWPYQYAYYDPFWYYGYGDIYAGIFSPYDYEQYVQGPGAPARMTALTQSAQQSCTDEAAEVTGWPIDQIQAAIQPNPQQSALLDALGNAVVKASDVIRSHCPTTMAFTPTDRLAEMQVRLEGLVQAVAMVQPPLGKFYDSLSDEQKARFNDIGATGGNKPSQAGQNPQAQCGENVQAFPADQVDDFVRPNSAQRAKLDALQAANAKAADLIKASCPSELPATPPDRLAAEGRHLQAMLAAVQTIRPALDDFYNSLSDEQKARFNSIGRQLYAEYRR